MPPLLFGDWRPDVSDYQQEGSKVIINAVARGDGYGPVRALQAFSHALGSTCRGSFLATNADGSIAVFAGTATKLYKLNNTDMTWTDVSRTSGGAYTLGPTTQWQFEQFSGDVVAVNQNDAPQVFNLIASANFTPLSGSPPQASFVTVVSNRLVLSGLLNNPDRIAWSALNDITGWTQNVNGSDIQDFGDGGGVLGVAGGEFGVVFQERAIRRMAFVGGDEIFEFERIVEGEGLAAPYSIIRAGPRVFFLGTSGFQSITSGQYPVSISKERFYRTFLLDWDDAAPQMMLGANEARSSRVWWFYKSLNGASGLFNRAICYDWALDKPSYVTGLAGEYVGVLSQPGVTLEGLPGLGFTDIDVMAISLDSYAGSSGQLLGLFDTTHSFGFLSGANLEATLDTPDYAFDKRFFVRAQRPITDAETVWGSVSTRQKIADDVVYSPETQMNSIGFCPHRADTRMARFRVRIPSGTTWTYATGTEPEAENTGKQ